jgi:CRP-like cAMP-binding protein
MPQDMLAQLYLFRGLPTSELQQIDRVTLLCHFDRDERIFPEGDPADALYMVKRGRIEVRQKLETGEDSLIASLSDGSHFGEMGFLDHSRRSACAICVDDCEVIQIHYEDLRHVCDTNPNIAVCVYQAIARFLASRLRLTTKKLSTANEVNLLLL